MVVKKDIKITNDKGRLSQDEIEKMVQEAEKYKEQDDKMKEQVDAKNDLESYTYQLKSAVSDDKNALQKDDRDKLQEKVDEVMKWFETANNASKEEIDSMKKDLEDVAKPIMEKLYANPTGGMPQGGAPGGMPEGAAPGGMNGPDLSGMNFNQEPTVEEVD